MLEQARQFFQAQNYGEAFNLIEQVLRLNPADTAALTLKGQLLGMANSFPEALTVIDQLLQINPNDALSWSMRGFVLTNLGHHQDALVAIDRSLALDARNPETHTLKNTIMTNRALAQNQNQVNQLAQNKFTSVDVKRSGGVAFALGLGLHLLGLIIGFAGFALLVVLHGTPALTGLFFISMGLAISCVNAARGSFRYGFIHLLLAIFLSLIAGGTLGAAYRVGLTPLITQLNLHPSLLTLALLSFLCSWPLWG
jgi:tetratricopeptide (TPR) repeat protein